ncbi:MAG: phosphatidylinositol mannoside acyltransferase [Nocardioidaceae bacterium]
MTGPGLAGVRRAANAASDNALTLGYLSGWKLVRRLPERQARALFDRIADRVYARDGRSVQQLRRNLARVAPGEGDLDALTHRAVRSYLRYWCESFRLPSWPVEDVVRRTRVVDESVLRDLYAQGRGVVAALPHMANWDWAGVWATANGMPLLTVAERLKPERLFDEFVAYRSSLGLEILPLTGGQPTFPRLVEWVGQGGLVCLLADRDLSRSGVEVELCGHRAKMPRGPALLAQQTGSPLMPVTLSYAGDGMEVRMHEPVPHAPGEDGIVQMMQGVADAFTEGLRAHPEDWHMMQRVFTEDLHS